MPKKMTIVLVILCMLMFFPGCGEVSLSTTDVNQVELPDGPDDLSKLGEALNGKSEIKVAITAPDASYILDSLSTIGEVETEEFSLEMDCLGAGDWTKLSDLATIHGLTTLILTGENDLSSLEPLVSLSDVSHLEIYDGIVTDLSPLAEMAALDSLYLELDHYDFPTLMSLAISNVEIPMRDTLWVAMDLLVQNPALEMINQMTTDTYSSKEYLEGNEEKIYYYNQFSYVFLLNDIMADVKAGQYTAAAEGAKAKITGSVIIAAPEDMLQDMPYREQDMLNTACGFEEDEDVLLYFPYMETFDAAVDDPVLVRFAGTKVLNDQFLVSISEDDCETVIFYYAYTKNTQGEGNGDTVTVSQPVAQIVDLRNHIVYDPVPLATVDPALETEQRQAAYLEGLNSYLSGLEIVE